MTIDSEAEFNYIFSQGLLSEVSNRWYGMTNSITYRIESNNKFYQFEVIYHKWMSGGEGFSEGKNLDLKIFPIKCQEVKEVEKIIKVWEKI